MDTRNKSTAKTPETGEASGRAWLRAVQQDKERKETQERSQEKAAPMASRQDDDDEVNYNEEASEQVGDPSKEKEVEPSELSSEEEEGDSQPVGRRRKIPRLLKRRILGIGERIYGFLRLQLWVNNILISGRGGRGSKVAPLRKRKGRSIEIASMLIEVNGRLWTG